MQGCWPPYRNAGFPPGFSMMEKRMRMFFHPKKLINSFLSEHLSKERALREEHILRINDSYMGRTRWDKALTFYIIISLIIIIVVKRFAYQLF